MVKFGSAYHFMYILLSALYAVILFVCLRKKDKKAQHKILTILAFVNLALHFAKLMFKPYRTDLPYSLSRITFDNICAASTIIFPFLFLMKKQNVLHDYMFFIGIVGGVGAILFPDINASAGNFSFDIVRFYFCHSNLFTLPLLASVFNIYRPRLKKFYAIPLLFIAHLTLIFLNEIFLVKVGLINSNMTEFLDKNIRNASFVFGLSDNYNMVKFLIDPLVPWFFKTDVFNINNGIPFYTPVLWLVIPAFIYLPIIYALMTAPFWLKTAVKDRKAVKEKVNQT